MVKLSGILFVSFLSLFAQSEWQSEIVYYNDEDRLVYVTDAEENRIPDFSYAGYKNGDEEIPYISAVDTIFPIEGDNTQHIQDAIDSLSSAEPDEYGFRGALFMSPGYYDVYGTIYLSHDGIVLRGAGDEHDPAANTIIRAIGNTPDKRSVIIAGGGSDSKWNDYVPGTYTYIESDSVMVGEREFDVLSASSLNVGDNIIIFHPCSADWLESIDYGGTHSDDPDAEDGVDIPWTTGSQPILYNRYITDIKGKTITIDAPVYNHLIKSVSQSYIYKYKRTNLKTHIGIENLRIDIQTSGGTDENHAWNAVDLVQIEDSWVRECTMLHFGLSGVITHTATRITIEKCKAIEPVSKIEGGKRYNFNVYTASQQILFKECHASDGRHHYMSNGTSYTSGIVFLDCSSSGAYASSEGHRRWSQGLLFDNHIELDGPRPDVFPRLLGLYNRGYYGTSHGWSSVHSVAWNCDVADGDLVVQKPPTGQNYAIGCSGANIAGVKPPASFDEPEGYIEGSGRDGLKPRSLYLAQLEERKYLSSISGPGMVDYKPVSLELFQNYPNPFNPQTKIGFMIHGPSDIFVRIYDINGRMVKELFRGRKMAGIHHLIWNGTDQNGKRVSAGTYFCRLSSGRESAQRKLLLLK